MPATREWQDIEELEQTEKGRRALGAFGTFPALLYLRVKRKKLFSLSDFDHFPEEFIEFYLLNARNSNTSNPGANSLKALVLLLPSPKSIGRLLKYHMLSAKTALFFKLSVDLLSRYYTTTEAPMFTTYRQQVIPLALEVYTALPATIITALFLELNIYNTTRKNFVRYIIGNKPYLLLLQTKAEYMAYYKSEQVQYNNLTAGNTRQLFYV
jgi:hypothetical protein